MSDIKDLNAMRNNISAQDESRFENYIKRLESLHAAMQSDATTLNDQGKRLDVGIERMIDLTTVFANTGRDILTSLEKSIPAAAEKLSKHALESIKAQVTGELTIEMERLQSHIAGYREELQGLQQDAHYARSMSRKQMALICLSAILGSGVTAATILIWSGVTLSNNTMTYQKVGIYVHNIIIKQPAEIQKSFWDGLAKLNHKE